MTGQRPVYLAIVEPLAAHWLLREIGERAEAYARQVVAYEGTPAAEQGRQLQRALAYLQEGVRWLREEQVASASDGPGLDDVGAVWLSTAEVASECLVSDRAVRGWIAGGGGPLTAKRVGRSWRVRADDLEDFRNGRAEVAG